MRAGNQGLGVGPVQRAYTLIELLCSIGIVVLLAALLLPTLQNGFARAQRLYCVNNLRQTGLAFHGFAHMHQDRFPMQVSTNDGGSLEYLQAANTITGEFYFSYRHFLPLANDLATPKVLDCPTDTRRAATNFAALQNDNLSYFVTGNPEFGGPNSALAGNRNVSPAFGSVATVGSYRTLRWTEELHRFRGNVLFSDGHVDQLNDVFSLTNGGAAEGAPTSLHLPTVRPEPAAPGAGGGYGYGFGGGGRPAPHGVSSSICAVTNQYGTNQALTNWWVTGSGGGRRGALIAFPPGADGGASGLAAEPDLTRSTLASPRLPPRLGRAVAEPDPWSVRGVYKRVVARGKVLLRGAAGFVYTVPWYLLLLLIAALIELRRRVRARHHLVVHHPLGSSASWRPH